MDILIYIFLGILSITGILLTVISLPGIWLIYICIVVLAWMGNFEILTPLILVIIFVLSLLSTLIDNIFVILGSKKLGGSKWGMIGAVVGVILGLSIGNLPGMFVGSFLGASLFELIFAKKDFNQSIKSGLGSFLGVMSSIVIKVLFCIGVIVYVLTLIV